MSLSHWKYKIMHNNNNNLFLESFFPYAVLIWVQVYPEKTTTTTTTNFPHFCFLVSSWWDPNLISWNLTYIKSKRIFCVTWYRCLQPPRPAHCLENLVPKGQKKKTLYLHHSPTASSAPPPPPPPPPPRVRIAASWRWIWSIRSINRDYCNPGGQWEGTHLTQALRKHVHV